MQNKGFTLIETLFVLLILGICFSFSFVISKNYHSIQLDMKNLHQKLLYLQTQSLLEKRKIQIKFQEEGMYVDGKFMNLNMQCKGELHFLPNGNVNKAMTIVCKKNKKQKELVIQLGSGRMYVK